MGPSLKRIAPLLACFLLTSIAVSHAQAQWIWDVTRESDGYGPPTLWSFSCSGYSCSACGTNADHDLVVYHSSTGGAPWAEQNVGLPNAHADNGHRILTIYQIDALRAIASGYLKDSTFTQIDSGFIVRTDDGGATWRRQYLPEKYVHLYGPSAFHFSSPDTGIGIMGRLIVTTSDGGSHWNLVPFQAWTTLASCISDGNGAFRAFGYGAAAKIYTTHDNWATVDSGQALPDSVQHHLVNLKHCLFSGDSVIAYGALLTPGPTTAMIAVSTDRGKSWLDPIVADSTVSGFSSLIYAGGDSMIAGSNFATFGKLAVSTNRGQTWHLDSMHFRWGAKPNALLGIARLPDGDFSAVFAEDPFHDDCFLARAHFGEADVAERRIISSSGIQLYPNPATDVVIIKSPAESGTVHVFDLLGQTVRSGILNEGGELRLDVSTLPRGIYSLMLDHGGVMLPIGKVALIAW